MATHPVPGSSDVEALDPPPSVLELARILENAGYEAWCVGGAVRDALLGLPHLDWDLATSATPERVLALFGRRRTIPVGIAFGTVKILTGDGVGHEVTTFRRDIRTDGRHAEVEFGVSLDDDLARRDFTINAIAYSASRRELRDPFGGRADLARGVVRAVGDPDVRMREDRLRALRAIRFASRFGFAIDPATMAAIRSSAPHLGRLSAERVHEELEKTMEQVRRPSVALGRWRDTGALRVLVPALGEVSDEILRALDALPQPSGARSDLRRLVRMATLFSGLSADDAAQSLRALRFSTRETTRIARLVDAWNDLGTAMRKAPASDADVREWVSRIGRLDVRLYMRLALARWSTASVNGATCGHDVRALHRRLLTSARHDPVDLGDLAVDGEDLKRAGVPIGPAIGRILRSLLTAVLEEPARNRTEWLLAEARRLARAPDSSGNEHESPPDPR